jgi:predicted acyltransferase (DUF342 family)
MNGNVSVPTQASSDNSSKVATTSYVTNKLASLTGETASFINDLNTNNRLFVGSDVSFNGKMFVSGDVSLNGNVSVPTQASSDNSSKVATTSYVTNKLASLTGETASFINDLNTNNRLFVGSDVSFNGKMFVNGDVSLNNRLFVGGDLSIFGRLIVMYDVSMNGNVYVPTPANSDNSTKVATTAFVTNKIDSIGSLESSSNFTTDVSMNRRLFVGGNITTTGNIVGNYGTGVIPSTAVSGIYTNKIIDYSTVGTGFVQRESGNNLYLSKLAVSGTGQYQIGLTYLSNRYYSSNYGVTWTASIDTAFNGQNWPSSRNTQCAMSYDGSIAYFWSNEGAGVLKSTNYGVNWAACPNIGLGGELQNALGASSTGQYVAVSVGNGTTVNVSSNYGNNWYIGTGIPFQGDQGWQHILVSSDGSYMVAVGLGGAPKMIKSSNYGVNWSLLTTPPSYLTMYQTASMTMNGTGQYQTFFTGSGTSVTSNYGATWTNVSLSIGNDTGGSSSSETGQYQMVVIGGSANYSTNYGYNWTATGISNGMFACAISRDGIVTTVASANVYTSTMSQYIELGDTTNKYPISTVGNVAINQSSVTNGFSLDVSGNIRYVAATATSDYRVKQDVKTLDGTFTVDNLHPVSYYNTLSNNQDIGLIAHELQEHYPFLVHGNKDDIDYQSINYTGLIGLLISEIQQLKKRVAELENK